MPEKVDFGTVHSIDVRPDPSNAELMGLTIYFYSGEKVVLAAQREALRGLWSYLTQILYPRAEALTKSMETVVRATHDIAPDVTHMVTAYGDSADPNLVVIGGFTRSAYWHLKLDWAATENLWSSLEDHLNQV